MFNLTNDYTNANKNIKIYFLLLYCQKFLIFIILKAGKSMERESLLRWLVYIDKIFLQTNYATHVKIPKSC